MEDVSKGYSRNERVFWHVSNIQLLSFAGLLQAPWAEYGSAVSEMHSRRGGNANIYVQLEQILLGIKL